MNKIMYSIVTTGPLVEPIDRDDIAKLDLKLLDETTEDDLLDILIQAAREWVEENTGRSLITQSRVIKFDYFPSIIELTNGPVQADSVVVKYFDSDDIEQTLDSDDYWVDTHSQIARVVVKNSWPSTMCRPNAVSVEYDAGYGDSADDVPDALKKACLFMLGHFYENRQNVSPVNSSEVPEAAYPLIRPYIITQYAGY